MEEESEAGQAIIMVTACSGVGRDWRWTDICGHSMLRRWKRLEQDIQLWTQHAQMLEEIGVGQTFVDITCSGVGRDWRRTGRCGHSMLRCWKRLAQDRHMWTQHAQMLEETGVGQTFVDITCSYVGRDWRRTDKCGHSMLRRWKRLAKDRQMRTQHAQVLEETGAGQTYVDTACSDVGRDWCRTDICGHNMLIRWKRLAQDRHMWTQHTQALEETGEGQANVDIVFSGVGRVWRRTGNCGQNMLRCWKRLDQGRQMWTQHAQVLEETGADRCGHYMLMWRKRVKQDRHLLWSQHAQMLEETGAGQTYVDITCSYVGRDWRRTGKCGHSILRRWKRLAKDRQMWTQHTQVLEETGEGQADVDIACSGVGRDWRRKADVDIACSGVRPPMGRCDT